MADQPLPAESPAPPEPPAKPLSLREQRFVDEFLICGVQAEAARRAGFSRKAAREAGREVATRPHVPRVVLAGIEVKRYMERRKRPARQVPPAQGASETTADQVLPTRASEVDEWEVLEFKIPDRQKAKELLGKHYGMFAETHRHVGAGGGPMETVNVTLTEAERAARVAELLAAARARRDGAGRPWRSPPTSRRRRWRRSSTTSRQRSARDSTRRSSPVPARRSPSASSSRASARGSSGTTTACGSRPRCSAWRTARSRASSSRPRPTTGRTARARTER